MKKAINLIKKLFLLVITLSILIYAANNIFSNLVNNNTSNNEEIIVEKGREYTTYEDVALYIHTYNELPVNYMSKKQAQNKGWEGGNPQNLFGGNVYIGGDKFSNLEQLLPTDKKYYECDVDYYDKTRGENRLIYTNDGKVYYTNDHYESFIELY